MIHTVTVTNPQGDSLVMDLARPEESGFAITSITGLGPSKATINTTDIAMQDGSFFNSAKAESRNIVIDLRYMWSSGIEDMRQLSYRYFPVKKKITLAIETDNRTLAIEGYVESNEPDIFSKDEGASISIICPYPYFYAVRDTIVAEFDQADANFEFPFSNESVTESVMEMSIMALYEERNVIYKGDADTGMILTMHITDAVKNVTIYNLQTRAEMIIDTDKLSGIMGSSGLIAEDEIVICTERGNKSMTLIRNGVKTNILNCLQKDADWIQLTKGDNLLGYKADEGVENIRFKIEGKVLYEGV